ncbi:gamma-tubulin complex component 2 [Nematocida displodere]|uniref:Gamma-tubulin complex component 2 n=1 Tax=Nematocida displodere TaxID=1805483 RepID=A0A177EDX3_9MICR|nr:gamma-tubulin complex component 2 [Nematocida displodere]
MYSLHRNQLVSDLLLAMVGLDSKMVQVKKAGELEVVISNSVHKDDARIVWGLSDIVLGVWEIKYRIEEAYYTKDHVKQFLLKGIEDEIEAFTFRLNSLCRSFPKKEMTVESLPFMFQEEVVLFEKIRKIIRDTEGAKSLEVLQAVLNARLGAKYSRIMEAVASPINKLVKKVVAGESVPEHFKERSRYDYGQCFWSSHYAVKNIPEYLQGSIDQILSLGKISKILRNNGDFLIEIPDILTIENSQAVCSKKALGEASFMILGASEAIHAKWQESIKDIFSKLLLETDKYSELFQEMGDKMFYPPDDKDITFVNYILKRGTLSYTELEERIDSQNLSFLSESAFILDAVDKEKASAVSFLYNEAPLSKVLTAIQDTRMKKSLSPVSLLQGIDLLFSPKYPLSMFSSTKLVSEVKIVFRLLFSLYAIEYHLAHRPGNWRVRHLVLSFVTALRMYITERVREEVKTLLGVSGILEYHQALETALANIMKASLLTTPNLIEFYSDFLSTTFGYIELPNRERLPDEDIDMLLKNYRAGFKSIIPSIKSPFLSTFVETLAGGQTQDAFSRLETPF